MEEVDEAELVRRVEAGDEAAFEELVRRHRRSVERLAARMLLDPRDREEVCQDVFLQVYRKIGDFEGRSRLVTWINSIAYRACLGCLEGRDTAIPGSQLTADGGREWFPDGLEGDMPSPARRAERTELRQAIRDAIGTLRPEYRAAVTMYHLEGMTVEEVAEAMSLPEGTAKSHLYRARSAIKDQLLDSVDLEEWRR